MSDAIQKCITMPHCYWSKQDKQCGFTLIELMIVIAIIGILASIAAPMYSQYVMRGRFVEVKFSVLPIKAAITNCYQRNAGSAKCNVVYDPSTPMLAGQVVAAALDHAAGSSIVSTVSLEAGAVPKIVVTVITGDEYNGETYTLTGTVAGTPGDDARIETWTEGGTACRLGWC